MTPVIGITTYDVEARWGAWEAHAALLPFVYVEAVRRSGGRAVLLPPGGDEQEASATVAGLDGLLVAGGPDIDPIRYGAARHPQTQPPVTVRDEWELAVTSHALRLGVPLLAICRGMQMLNVCRGGTLHQHVPDLVGHARHDGPTAGYGRHQVRVSPDSMLAGILTQAPSDEYFNVPTHHHQAVNLLGDGLKAVAWEEDGTIEAVEAGPSALDGLSGFVLGVQWHPERGDDPRLFTALVDAATARAATARAATARAAAKRGTRGAARRGATTKAGAERAAARSTVLAPMI
jgi:putative glutamine amidotransferase